MIEKKQTASYTSKEACVSCEPGVSEKPGAFIKVYDNLFIEVTKTNIDFLLSRYKVVACKIRNSRIKVKQTAVLEMIFSQYEKKILFILNGPLGDIKGIISFFCPKENLLSLKENLFSIGYCDKFYLLDFDDTCKQTDFTVCKNQTNLVSINPLVWKGRKFSIDYFFIQDNKVYEEQSPHNREFKILDSGGEEKTVIGYRGDGSETGRRSLPVEDARCIVNLSMPWKNKKFIDPFAGAGGIIFAFKYIASQAEFAKGSITSIDIDPVLKPGLNFLSDVHYTMDAKDAAFAENSFDSIITETPFSNKAVNDINTAISKILKSLTVDGILVIMCKTDQTERIYESLFKSDVYLIFNQMIDRKGIDVEISVWCKDKEFFSGMEKYMSILSKIH